MTDQIEQTYHRHVSGGTAIAPHLCRLWDLAKGLDLAVEFGVKRGASSSALLLGARRVMSFDVVATAEAKALKTAAGDRWDYRIEDSRTAAVPDCDLLFIDSLHTFAQMRAELFAHGNKALRYIVCHDVGTFGEVDAVGETGAQAWKYVQGQSVPLNVCGIRPAIDEFQIENPHWRVAARYVDSHGLLVLKRDAN